MQTLAFFRDAFASCPAHELPPAPKKSSLLGVVTPHIDFRVSLRAYAELQAVLNAKPKAKIAVPSIYVQGAEDACDLPPCSEHQASFFTAPYKRILLKGSGHFPHREDPKTIASHLSHLIRQHS